MTDTKHKGRIAEFDNELVRNVSEAVYRDLLERENPPEGAVARMLEKDGDGGVKLRERAACFDRHTRAYFRALNTDRPIEPKNP